MCRAPEDVLTAQRITPPNLAANVPVQQVWLIRHSFTTAEICASLSIHCSRLEACQRLICTHKYEMQAGLRF